MKSIQPIDIHTAGDQPVANKSVKPPCQWGLYLAMAAVLPLCGTTVRAATTGFNQTAAGPWDYNDPANWAATTINGIWNTDLTLAAAQTVTFAADTVLTTGLTFNYAGNYALLLDAAAAGTKTLTLAGDIGLNTGGGTSANVTLGDATNHLDVNLGGATRAMTVSAGRALTLLDVVSNGGITKAGTGVLTLAGANNYTLGTAVNTGALSFLKTAAKPGSDTTTVAAGATLGLGVSGDGAYISDDVDALFASPATLANVTMTDGANVGIDTSLGDFIYTSNTPANNRGLTKLGANKLTLTGTHAYTGNTTVYKGTLELPTGSSITSAGHFYGAVDNNRPAIIMSGNSSITLTSTTSKAIVGGNNNSVNPSSMVMSGSSSFTTAGIGFSVGGFFSVQGGPSGSGEFAMKDSATVTVQSTSLIGFFVQGDGVNGTAHMLLADSAKVICNRFTVSSNFGTLTQTGADSEVNVDRSSSSAADQWVRIANGMGRWGWYNMTAGKFNVKANPGGTPFIVGVGMNQGLGFMNITGTAEVNIAADADFRLCANQSGTLGWFGEVNLAGGTLTTPNVSCPDSLRFGGVFNFNGGTLKAAKSTSYFMQNLKGSMNTTPGAAYVHAGGAVIDTNNFDIGISEPLLEPAGLGVTSISFNPGTQTYVAPPRVSFSSDANGQPATAQGFATLDSSGNINGIIITNPGFGYTSAPAVTFDRGDASATSTLGVIGGGGLTKKGAGTLTLYGINTYTGDTVVNDGTLVVGDTGGLRFKIGANGVNSKLRGTATVVLNGAFSIDISGADKTDGNSWLLVDVDALGETFGDSFYMSGTGWTQSTNVWTMPDGIGVWTFTEATGVLTYEISPYLAWAEKTFTNPFTDKDPTHDPDGDGMSNQQEFAYGLDPTTGSSCNPITVPLNQASHKFTYTRYAASDLTYTVWTSSSLQTWSKVLAADMTENISPPNGAGVATVEVTLTSPPAGDKLFVRVQAE